METVGCSLNEVQPGWSFSESCLRTIFVAFTIIAHCFVLSPSHLELSHTFSVDCIRWHGCLAHLEASGLWFFCCIFLLFSSSGQRLVHSAALLFPLLYKHAVIFFFFLFTVIIGVIKSRSGPGDIAPSPREKCPDVQGGRQV